MISHPLPRDAENRVQYSASVVQLLILFIQVVDGFVIGSCIKHIPYTGRDMTKFVFEMQVTSILVSPVLCELFLVSIL